MITQAKTLLAIALLASLALSPRGAHGASITWNTPQNISGVSDVSTSGTLIGAANVGDVGVPSTTVNGVTFMSFAAPGGNGTSGMFTMTAGGGGVFQSNTGGASPNPPFSTLPANYQTLLSSYVVPLFSPVTLTMSGLTIGMQYQFQFWSNLSSQSFSYQISATAGNSISLGSNADHADGGLGQWVTGTFTADAIFQSIDFIGDGDGGFLNAFQLRLLDGATSVPESGNTLALLGIAVSGLSIARRKLRAGSVAH
jgi:hypothetical protein